MTITRFVTGGNTLHYDRTAYEQNATIVDFSYAPGNVLRYGADPTGATDSTAAFNFATRSDYQSTGNNDLNFASEVIVPAGEFRIDSPVYVHKGQHLKGAGEGATRLDLSNAPDTDDIFKLGAYESGFDLGGLPPNMSGFWISGGPTTNAVIVCGSSGVVISDLFLTSPGYGIEITGTDARVSNIQVDQGGVAFRVGGHSHNFTNILMYSMNYGVSTVGNCYDINFSDMQFYYCKFNGVLFADTFTHDNLVFNSPQFLLNAQGTNFTGFIRAECDNAKNLIFNDATFRNMKDAAINGPSTASGNEMIFNNPVFDGNKTDAAYTQSTTAYACFTVNNRVIFNNPEFKNLLNDPVFTNGGTSITDVEINGGLVENCSGSAIMDVSTTDPLAGSRLAVNGVRCKDQEKQPFTVQDGGWHLETDLAMVLTGNGATTIAQYPFGRNSTYFVDTSTLAAEVRLPRSDANANVTPKNGDKLTFIDYDQDWVTNNVTFLRGDNTINGAASDYVANTAGGKVIFTFNSTTSDWNAAA